MVGLQYASLSLHLLKPIQYALARLAYSTRL
jgi:hypothetical protein